jgi:hypothetical protein
MYEFYKNPATVNSKIVPHGLSEDIFLILVWLGQLGVRALYYGQYII